MHDEMGKSEFENLGEDQIMQEDDTNYSSMRDRPRSFREIRERERQGEHSNPENQTITRSTRRTRGIRHTRFREM